MIRFLRLTGLFCVCWGMMVERNAHADEDPVLFHLFRPAAACAPDAQPRIYNGAYETRSLNGSVSCPLAVDGDNIGHLTRVMAYVSPGFGISNCWIIELYRDGSYSQYYPRLNTSYSGFDVLDFDRIALGWNGADAMECGLHPHQSIRGYYQEAEWRDHD